MDNQNKKQLKTLTEIVTGLSSEIEKEKVQARQPNIFEESVYTHKAINKEPVKDEKREFRSPKKINSLESEFYAPNSIEDVFSEDILLEQKIIRLKKELELINNRIKAESNFENPETMNSLMWQKNGIKKELEFARKEYAKIPTQTKIKNKFYYCVKFLLKGFSNLNIFKNFDLKTFSTSQPLWKKNLQKLDSINDEIDEILRANTPYGENEDRYERLSESLNQALKLRNNINKEM